MCQPTGKGTPGFDDSGVDAIAISLSGGAGDQFGRPSDVTKSLAWDFGEVDRRQI
jgi:hypothetical protein